MVVALVATSGCAGPAANPVLTPIEVKIPIPSPVYCTVAKLAKPELPIAGLKSDSPPADTIRAYAATVAILKGAVRERDAEIAGCAAPSSDARSSTPAATSAETRSE